MLMNIFLLIAPSGYQFKIYGFYTFFVILLLLAELRFPHWTTPYQTPYQRIADHISVLIYSLFFTTVVIYLFRRSYNAEQQLIRSQKKELEFAYKEATEKNRYIQSLILELHHRVKNNLQVVSSLMALQATRSLDKNTKLALEDGRKRIEVMALVHQRLYLSSELSSVPLKSYLQDLALSLSESFGYELGFIKLEFDLSDEPISIDIAIPVGLIFNELVTNAFKHAFKNIKNPLLVVKLEDSNNGGLLLTVADNGIGLNLAQAKKQINTFGTKLVELLVKQLHGELILENKSGLTAKILINRYGKN